MTSHVGSEISPKKATHTARYQRVLLLHNRKNVDQCNCLCRKIHFNIKRGYLDYKTLHEIFIVLRK